MASWDRQPKETDKQFAAFSVYRDLGPGRSIDRAYIAMKGALPDNNRGRAPKYWFDWSRHLNWKDRVAEYDAFLDNVRAQAAIRAAEAEGERIARQVRAHKNNEVALAGKMSEIAMAILQRGVVRSKTVVKDGGKTIINIHKPYRASVNSAAILARIASELGRRGLDIPDDENTVTPTDFKSMFYKEKSDLTNEVPDGALPAKPDDVAVNPNLQLPSPAHGANGNSFIASPRVRPEGY